MYTYDTFFSIAIIVYLIIFLTYEKIHAYFSIDLNFTFII
jgi:hypothetical protein